MREQLNSNPLVQMAVVAVLLVAGAIFVFTSMGGGSEEEGGGSLSASAAPPGEGAAPSPSVTPATPEGATPGAGSAIAERPLPRSLMSAWKANQTVVLLFVHDGGIDDDLVKLASASLDGMQAVTTFIVPADQIARYAAITQGVGVERVPALVVLRPRRLDQSAPTASVSYGFQDAESIVQAVIDAGYNGPTLEYHP